MILDRSILRLRGAQASIRWGYHEAMALGSWSFTGSGQGGQLTATVLHRDAFRLTQRPLQLVLMVNGLPVRWPVHSITEEGSSVQLQVGPKETR